MGGFLDGTGVLYLWDKLKSYVDEKFGQIGPGSAGEDGKSAYQYAVDGGYTGTEEEFQALMADGATKTYVDNLFSRVAPVIVQVELINLGGSLMRSYNVKCYPTGTGTESYSINFSVPPDRTSSLNYIKITPPEQYAFTGLYQSSGLIMELGADIVKFGILRSDGTIVFVGFISDDQDKSWIITGSFTLEVA